MCPHNSPSYGPQIPDGFRTKIEKSCFIPKRASSSPIFRSIPDNLFLPMTPIPLTSPIMAGCPVNRGVVSVEQTLPVDPFPSAQ